MNRREFLSTAAATVAGTALATHALSAESFQKASGMNYAPEGKPNPVVKPGEFVFAAAHLDHGHINGMCNGLTEAGATLKWVYDTEPRRIDAFRSKFPQVRVARSMDEILSDSDVRLVAAAAVPSERSRIGRTVLEAGRDYFSDKAPFTTLEQLEETRATVARTGRKYMVYYAERLHNESAMYATDLLRGGAIGKVIQVVTLAPHRLSKASRPDWFFLREKSGGILCDIGSHEFEQFLAYTGSLDATISHAAVGNYANLDHPEFEDFGEAGLVGDTGALSYIRVDWFTPEGLSTWGDGRTFVIGTQGTIELRKYVDVAREKTGDHLYIVDAKGEQHLSLSGKVGYRFFGEFILDCLNRTEKAMTQAHAFKAAELSLKAQASARRLT